MPIRKFNRKRRTFKKFTRKAKIATNNVVATRALRLAKLANLNTQIQHWKVFKTPTTFKSTDNWHVDGIDMTTGAVGDGWLANYTTGKFGVAMYTIGHMSRSTTQELPGYRSGNTMLLRSFWIKGKLIGNITSNTRIRMMLVKAKGALRPEDLPFYDSSPVTTAPDISTFTDTGKSSKVATVLMDKIIKVSKYDNEDLTQVKYFNIFKKPFTKYFYGTPTLGSASATLDPSNSHDIAEGTFNYYLVFCNESTNAVTVDLNMLINYVP